MRFLTIHLMTILFLITSNSSCKKDDLKLENIATTAELTMALEKIFEHNKVPGFALSVVKNEKVIYKNAFGFANINAGVKYTNNTVQPIGSISKTFIAAAIVSAIEQGYFNLETDINEILPFEVHNPYFPNEIITVKHLVSHTSGLLDNLETYFGAYHILPGEDLSTAGSQLLQNAFSVEQRQTISLGEFLSSYYVEGAENNSLSNFSKQSPGVSWAYSNIAASLAAYLVEVATGIPFSEYVSTNILNPLGMYSTHYYLADIDMGNKAKLYWDQNTPLPNYFNDSYPDGSINTSNEDLSKYLLDMMKGAQGKSSTLFTEAGYDMLFGSILLNGTVPADIGESQGIFWFLKDGKIQHSGSDPGTTCNLEFDASSKSGYLLLSNMDASSNEHESDWYRLNGQINQAITSFINAN